MGFTTVPISLPNKFVGGQELTTEKAGIFGVLWDICNLNILSVHGESLWPECSIGELH